MPQLIIDAYPPLDFNYLVEIGKNYRYLKIDNKKKILDTVVSAHPVFNCALDSAQIYYRVRIVGKNSITHVEDVIWPKSSTEASVRFGDICYLSNSLFTALDEKEVKHDEIVIITKFRMIPESEIRLFPIGEIDSIVRSGKGYFVEKKEDVEKIQNIINACTFKNYYATLAYIMQDSFLFEQLTCKNHIISKYTLQKILNNLQAKIDVVGFPSVKRRGGRNIGVATNNFWNNWAILSISKIHVKRLPFGYYDLIFLEHVSDIGRDGIFYWEKNVDKNMKEYLLLPQPYRPDSF